MIIHYYFVVWLDQHPLWKRGSCLFHTSIVEAHVLYFVEVIIRNNWSVRDFICVQRFQFVDIYICIMCVRFIEKCQRIQAIVCTPSAVSLSMNKMHTNCTYWLLLLWINPIHVVIWNEKPWNKFSGTIVLEVNARICALNELFILYVTQL